MIFPDVHMTPDQRLNELIAASMAGTIDAAGKAELEALLQRFPEQRAVLSLLEQYWKAVPAETAPPEAVFQQMMAEAVEVPASAPSIKRSYRWLWSAAAVAGILLGLFFFQRSGKPATDQVVQTMDGERKVFRLSDATVVHLNGGSRLRCVLDAGHRELWLDGEAYFEVARDPGRPFVVHAAGVNIRALGTAFNVKAYLGQPKCETTLLQGAVEVYTEHTPDRKIRLRPYEKLALDATGIPTVPIKKINLKPVHAGVPVTTAIAAPAADSSLTETAWVSNRLQFDAVDFEELALLLQRWYGVQITFRNEKPKHYVFSGAFANESVTQALSALQLTEDFRYEVQGKTITIY